MSREEISDVQIKTEIPLVQNQNNLDVTSTLNTEEVSEGELYTNDLTTYQDAALELLSNTETVLKFDGKTPDDWAREHYINIPDDCNAQDVIKISQSLLQYHAIVSRYCLAAEAAKSSIQTVLANQKIKEIQKIVKELEKQKKRRPAKDHLEALAEERLSRIVGAANYIDARYNFWRGRQAYLNRVQELIRSVSFLIHSETKTLDGY